MTVDANVKQCFPIVIFVKTCIVPPSNIAASERRRVVVGDANVTAAKECGDGGERTKARGEREKA